MVNTIPLLLQLEFQGFYLLDLHTLALIPAEVVNAAYGHVDRQAAEEYEHSYNEDYPAVRGQPAEQAPQTVLHPVVYTID